MSATRIPRGSVTVTLSRAEAIAAWWALDSTLDNEFCFDEDLKVQAAARRGRKKLRQLVDLTVGS